MEFKTESYVLAKAGLLKKVALAASRSTKIRGHTNPVLGQEFDI